MASLSLHHPRSRFFHNLPKRHLQCPTPTNYPKIICGLRAGPRKPLWRSRVLSTEAIQVIQSLKLAKSASKLEEVFSGRLSRLLKADLLDVLTELRRQNELELALQVFKFVRKEVWYKPDLSLYCDMIMLLGKNNLIEMAEEFFSELKQESLEPDTRAFTEMIGAYIRVGMIDKAMEMYKLMKETGVAPDRLTFKILIRNLQGCGEDELAAVVKRDCVDYIDSPEKFIEEVEKRHVDDIRLVRTKIIQSRLCIVDNALREMRSGFTEYVKNYKQEITPFYYLDSECTIDKLRGIDPLFALEGLDILTRFKLSGASM